jgi:hypothetical protein
MCKTIRRVITVLIVIAADEVIATIPPSPAPFLDPRSRREAEERLGAAEATSARKLPSNEPGRSPSRRATISRARARWLSVARRQFRPWNARNWPCASPIGIYAPPNS